MKIIVCLDKNNGLMFNNRRQSRDKAVIEDIIKNFNNVCCNSYSRALFPDDYLITLSEEFLDNASEYDYCFVENVNLKPYLSKISEFVIYNWNRVYPCDYSFEFNLKEIGFKRISQEKLIGNSHDKITKEVFVIEK